MKDRPGGRGASVLPAARLSVGVGVEPGGRGRWWGGVGTLLGPEGSGPPALVRVVCSWSLRASLAPARASVWVGGCLVGLLFEICIVDASILYRCP